VCSDRSLFQLLDHGTHRVTVFSQARSGRCRCVAYIQLFQWQDILQVTQKYCRIFFRPQVYVDSVYFVEIFLLIVLVVGAQVPLILSGDRRLVQHESEQRRLLIRVCQALDGTQISRERILLGSSSMIGDFELRPVLCRVVIKICIAAFRKSVVDWSRRRVIEVVVDIGEAAID